MTKPQRVLGIDPGSHHLGVGCIEKSGNKLRLLFADTLHAPKGEPLYARLDFLARGLAPLIEQISPDVVAVEDIFYAKNVRSAVHLGMARGVAVALCLRQSLSIFEYAPTQVKLVVTGYGKADKAQVAKMVALQLGIRGDWPGDKTPGPDATDALAVAICHACHHVGIHSRKNNLEKPRDFNPDR